ncbi:MAG TPA: NAD(P)H-dependent oxidoreductase subunit E [Bacillota bacterium]|nr:NAD(P)H-dependent oxidoreductase subunit E [Bacillota bacterium]
MIITVCIGSGCHVKGSRQIIEILQTMLAGQLATSVIELEACFCQGKCTEGVVVKFDGVVRTGVTPDNIRQLVVEQLAGGCNP